MMKTAIAVSLFLLAGLSAGQEPEPVTVPLLRLTSNPVGMAKPPCNASYRGTLWLEYEPAGNLDSFQVCLRSEGGAFAWTALEPRKNVGGTIASASTIAVTEVYHPVSGVAAIATINGPRDRYVGLMIQLRPTGAFTTTTAGNIGRATTAVVGRVLALTWDGTKWWPSY